MKHNSTFHVCFVKAKCLCLSFTAQCPLQNCVTYAAILFKYNPVVKDVKQIHCIIRKGKIAPVIKCGAVMKEYTVVEVLDGGVWFASLLGRFTQKKISLYTLSRSWGGPQRRC
jgi:hypothetical protein